MTESRTRRLAGTVIALTAVGIVLRVGYLLYITNTLGFEWIDPDGYGRGGWLLSGGGTDWHWDPAAVRYRGSFVKAPLYQMFLSLFVSSPDSYFWPAAIGQAIVGALAVPAMWSLGRDLHSERAGLLAAAIYAVYFPSIVMLNAFMQERLYIPLLILAFACLARAIVTRGPWLFALAGGILALGALTRSMPVYFAGPAAVLIVWTSGNVRTGLRHALMFLAAFLLIVVPYSIIVSREFSQVIIIENIGAFGLAQAEGASDRFGLNRAPNLMQVGQLLWPSFASAPLGFVRDHIQLALSMFQLGGGRWLEVHGSLPTALSADVAKFAAHLVGDLPLVAAAFLGPFGLAVARRSPIAGLLTVWIAVHLCMTVLAGYAGQRFREPVDWVLIVGLGAVLAGEWQRSSRLVTGLALVIGIAFAWSALQTAPATLSAHADYGITPWTYGERSRTVRARPHAGFSAFPVNGVIEFLVQASPDAGVPPAVTVDGVPVQVWRGEQAEDDGYRFRVPSNRNRSFATIDIDTRTETVLQVSVFDYPVRYSR